MEAEFFWRTVDCYNYWKWYKMRENRIIYAKNNTKTILSEKPTDVKKVLDTLLGRVRDKKAEQMSRVPKKDAI